VNYKVKAFKEKCVHFSYNYPTITIILVINW